MTADLPATIRLGRWQGIEIGARARKASVAVCSPQLRVVGVCEVCDGVTDKPITLHHSRLWWGFQMGAYEHNFGFWDIDGPEERAFFQHVHRQSVIIACERCKHLVQLMPPKPSALLASPRSNVARRPR